MFSKYIRRNESDVNKAFFEACEDIKVDFTSAKTFGLKLKIKTVAGEWFCCKS
jgi:hypothetical protein